MAWPPKRGKDPPGLKTVDMERVFPLDYPRIIKDRPRGIGGVGRGEKVYFKTIPGHFEDPWRGAGYPGRDPGILSDHGQVSKGPLIFLRQKQYWFLRMKEGSHIIPGQAIEPGHHFSRGHFPHHHFFLFGYDRDQFVVGTERGARDTGGLEFLKISQKVSGFGIQ